MPEVSRTQSSGSPCPLQRLGRVSGRAGEVGLDLRFPKENAGGQSLSEEGLTGGRKTRRLGQARPGTEGSQWVREESVSTIIKGLIKFCCSRFIQGPGTWVPTLDLGPVGADQGPA